MKTAIDAAYWLSLCAAGYGSIDLMPWNNPTVPWWLALTLSVGGVTGCAVSLAAERYLLRRARLGGDMSLVRLDNSASARERFGCG